MPPRRRKPEPEPPAEPEPEAPKQVPESAEAAITMMLGAIFVEAFPKEDVPNKLAAVAHKLGIPNPFDGDAAKEAYPRQVPCPHGSFDGQACCAMDCHVADVPGRLDVLRRRNKAEQDATEEFTATFGGGGLSAKGELTLSLKPHVPDQWKLHRTSVARQGATVEVVLHFPVRTESSDDSLQGQGELPLAEGPVVPPIEVMACSTCHRIIKSEDGKPGGICPSCAGGELVLLSVTPLYCSECKQTQELSTSKPGDTCTLCKEGRYLAGVAESPKKVAEDYQRFIPMDRVAEFSDAVSGAEIAQCQIKAVLVIRDERFVVSEILGSDPITYQAWKPVLMDDYSGTYHNSPEKNLDCLRVTLGEDGAAFVLVGPPYRIIAKAEEPEAKPSDDPWEEQT